MKLPYLNSFIMTSINETNDLRGEAVKIKNEQIEAILLELAALHRRLLLEQQGLHRTIGTHINCTMNLEHIVKYGWNARTLNNDRVPVAMAQWRNGVLHRPIHTYDAPQFRVHNGKANHHPHPTRTTTT